MDRTVMSQALKRIAIAQGHLGTVKKMVEEDAYCPDIIHQSRAVQAALRKVDEIILHGHLHSCVIKDIHAPASESEKLIGELVGLFKRSSQ